MTLMIDCGLDDDDETRDDTTGHDTDMKNAI